MYTCLSFCWVCVYKENCWIISCAHIQQITNSFPTWLYQFHSHQQCISLIAPYPHHTWNVHSLILAIPVGMQWYPVVIFSCIFLVTNEVESLSIYLLAIWKIPFVKYLFKFLAVELILRKWVDTLGMESRRKGMSTRWNSMYKLMVYPEHGSKWTDSGKSASKMLNFIRAYEVMTAISHRSK